MSPVSLNDKGDGHLKFSSSPTLSKASKFLVSDK